VAKKMQCWKRHVKFKGKILEVREVKEYTPKLGKKPCSNPRSTSNSIHISSGTQMEPLNSPLTRGLLFFHGEGVVVFRDRS
jgi:hypothetical protein